MSFLFVVVMFLNVLAEEKVFCSVNIGGIFEGPDHESEIAFRVAVDMANNQYGLPQKTLTPLIANIEPEAVTDKHRALIGITWDRPLVALKTACSLSSTGVVGIVSPLSRDNTNSVQSVCDAKEIPFIQTTPDRRLERECCSINLFPSIYVFARAFADLVQRWDWKSFTIMYETDDSFANIAELLKLYDTNEHLVVLEQLRRSEYGDYRDDLKKIRKSKQTNFVLQCENKNLNDILEQAQQVGLMMKRYSYIIINLDLHTIDLSLYKDSETNITSLQLVSPTNPDVIKVAEAMQEKRKELGLQNMEFSEAAWKLELSTALIVDAIMLFAETLRDVGEFEVNPLFCNASDSWEHGSTLFNFMKMKTINGLTGPIKFDHLGIRSDFALDVVELTEQGLVRIGTWNSQEGLSISRANQQTERYSDENSMKNMSINVMIAWSEPYALYKNESTLLKGNDQYEGFVIDLIQEISLIEGFTYTLLRNPDDKNGDYNSTTKTWNGMIGDILSGTGDIAIGDLTITRQRKEFVDFTTPFMTSGIQILYKKPSKAQPVFFAFADPFKPMVWLLIGVSYFAVSLGLYIMARFCPSEWDNWDPCVQEPKYNFNQFGARNSLWYMLGCLLQEGADIAPRGASTRILSGVWAFFILVIVSYYKAQLAASLTVESYEIPFNNVEELVNKADQIGIRYGTVANEAVHTYFKQSPVKLHQTIAAHMDTHPELMVEDNYGGYLLIDEGDYAFFTESVFAKFATTAVCYLTTIGEPMNEQNFAIAMRKGYPYRAALSKAILKLLESGKVGELQKKWWEEEKFRLPDCEEAESSSIAPPLNYHHVAGIFWITFGGIFAACVLAFIELAIFVFYKCGQDYQNFLRDYKEELRFYFSFKDAPKPVKNGRIATFNTETQNQVNETSS